MKTIWLVGIIGLVMGVATGCDRGQVKVTSPAPPQESPKPATPTATPLTNAAAVGTNAAARKTDIQLPAAVSNKLDAAAKSIPPSATAPMNTNQVAVIKTTSGEMVVEFWPEVAPKTVENFKKLAASGFYDGTCFHRIVKGFMIQGGDPLTKDKDPGKESLWGTGGPGYKVNAEFNERAHRRGVLSMARSADPNSAGSQFFICLGDASFLDRQYTAFGKLIRGDDVLGQIGDTPVVVAPSGEQSKPTVRIEVLSVTLVDRGSVK